MMNKECFRFFAAMSGWADVQGLGRPRCAYKPEKVCLLPGCNNMTSHNGGYCCADHCREHRRLRKVNATAQREFVGADGCEKTGGEPCQH